MIKHLSRLNLEYQTKRNFIPADIIICRESHFESLYLTVIEISKSCNINVICKKKKTKKKRHQYVKNSRFVNEEEYRRHCFLSA